MDRVLNHVPRVSLNSDPRARWDRAEKVWVHMLNFKIKDWPGLTFGPYPSLEVATLSVEDQLSRKGWANDCGFYPKYDCSMLSFYPWCNDWQELTAHVAFQWYYNAQRQGLCNVND